VFLNRLLRLLDRLLHAAVRLLPAERAGFALGLLAESQALPPNVRLRWLAGGFRFVLREVLVRFGLYLGGVAATVAALVRVDVSPSDVANQASLLVLVLGSGALGFAVPRQAWVAGVAVGSCLAVAHAVYTAAGIRLPYPMSPSGWAGAATLLLLIVPGMIAAYAGAGAGTLVRRRRSA
jgi:hypothetical protein